MSTTLSLVLLVVQFALIASAGYSLRRARQARAAAQAAQPMNVIADNVGKAIQANMSLHVDLLERLAIDLQFLHDKAYGSICQADCPVCTSTKPQLAKWIQELRSVRFELHMRVEEPPS